MLDTNLDIQTLYAQLNPQLKSQYDHFFANDEPYLIPDPMNPTDIESEYLALIAGLQPPPLPAFFLRYFILSTFILELHLIFMGNRTWPKLLIENLFQKKI